MENIEQLKQDNLKLTERLNNAAKFFREQKAQIETLTKENEELKSNIQSKDKAYEVLQNTYNEVFAENEELKSKPKDDYVSPEKWNALVTEKESLDKQLNEYELKLQKLEGDYKDLKKVYEDEQSEYENKLKEKETLHYELAKNYESYKKTQSELVEKLQTNLEKANIEIDTLETQKAVQASLQKQLDDLQEKSTVTLHEFKKLQTEYDKLTNEYNKCFEEKNKLFEENNDLSIKLNNIIENSEIRNEILDKIVSLINGLNNVNNNQTKVTKNNNSERIGNEYVVDNPVMNI